MESPVVLDKPPEYHGNDRGFPFDDEEASGAWSELAARHPDIAARLRQRPASATWARKRRPSSQDATDDFGENFSGFDNRFPFDDIPPEFREHFPSHWNRRFPSREEAPPQPPPPASPPQPPQNPQPPQQTAATQTETHTQTEPEADIAHSLPQYGLRNTVDLGQKSPADPRLVDGGERAPRSMSAPPEPRPPRDMSAPPPPSEPANVRHIPIFVEGRDEPVISRGEPAPSPHHPAPHIDRDAYFADDTPSFHHPPNFTRAFGTPGGKPFRSPPQPFMQQKVYPQAAYNRAPSPQRDRSPRPPQPHPHPSPPQHEEPFVKVPVHHQQAAPPRAPPSPAAPPQQPPQREATPPYVPPKPVVTDPITQILSIQTDVLNLMTEVENFTGTKRDKRYLFLDEMLTRNLIKLDNIETEGKENIRLARKEAIRCIQKCIAVLEAKAEKNGNPAQEQPPADDAMSTEQAPANGDVEMNEQAESQTTETAEESKPSTEPPQEAPAPLEPAAAPEPPQEHKPSEEKPEETKDLENKPSPKKKVVKKRDKSKDKAAADSAEAKDSDKVESEVMQVDNKGDKTEQVMEVDGAASQ